MLRFPITTLFPTFHSGGLGKEEFEEMIKEAVRKEHPRRSIKNIRYLKDGVEVILDDGESIDIEIDWNEIIIS